MRTGFLLFFLAVCFPLAVQTGSAEEPREIQKLVRQLKSGNAKARLSAAMRLGNLGREAESALSDLEDVLDADTDPRVKRWAKQAAEKIRTDVAHKSGLDQPAFLRLFPVAKSRGGTIHMIDETACLGITLDGENSAVGIRTQELVTLDGLLAVTLRNGYQPQIGTAHEIIATTKMLEGRFRYFNLPDLPPDRAWRLHYDHLQNHDDLDGDGRTDVTLVVVPKMDAWPAEAVDKPRAEAYRKFQKQSELASERDRKRAAEYRNKALPFRKLAMEIRTQAANSSRAFFLNKEADHADRKAKELERFAKSFEVYARENAELARRLKQRLASGKFPPLPAIP